MNLTFLIFRDFSPKQGRKTGIPRVALHKENRQFKSEAGPYSAASATPQVACVAVAAGLRDTRAMDPEDLGNSASIPDAVHVTPPGLTMRPVRSRNP